MISNNYGLVQGKFIDFKCPKDKIFTIRSKKGEKQARFEYRKVLYKGRQGNEILRCNTR